MGSDHHDSIEAPRSFESARLPGGWSPAVGASRSSSDGSVARASASHLLHSMGKLDANLQPSEDDGLRVARLAKLELPRLDTEVGRLADRPRRLVGHLLVVEVVHEPNRGLRGLVVVGAAADDGNRGQGE